MSAGLLRSTGLVAFLLRHAMADATCQSGSHTCNIAQSSILLQRGTMKKEKHTVMEDCDSSPKWGRCLPAQCLNFFNGCLGNAAVAGIDSWEHFNEGFQDCCSKVYYHEPHMCQGLTHVLQTSEGSEPTEKDCSELHRLEEAHMVHVEKLHEEASDRQGIEKVAKQRREQRKNHPAFIETMDAATDNKGGSEPANTFTTIGGCRCKSDCEAWLSDGFKCDTCWTEDRCGSWSIRGGYWDVCDYRPQTVQSFTDRSAFNKQEYYWNNIVANKNGYTHYPLLKAVITSVRPTFDNYRPEMPPKREKIIHTVGSVCKIKVEIGRNSPYTGLLATGTHHGFIRMGGAVKPRGGLTPGLGFKFPRDGRHDGDWVALYSLKFGDQWDFFGKNQSNHIAPGEGIGAYVLGKKFEDASNCINQIGLSDLTRYSQKGEESHAPKFPFKLFLSANPSKDSNVQTGRRDHTIAGVHAELDSIPEGSLLYSLFACSTAKGNELEPTESVEKSCGSPLLLGDIRTTSQCTTSWYGDKSFHIRHQRIEEDWALNPSLMNMRGYSADEACDKHQKPRGEGAPPKCGPDFISMLNSDVR